MPSTPFRTIDEIRETLENAKSRGRGCALLIGAGCSVKAGIPVASDFVNKIRETYKLAYARAPEKTYAKCMSQLLLAERRDLIAKYVDAARVNWAHLCIALLMKEGYVDRVLTTNFDLLVVRACAMLGVFPAVYDFASSQLLQRADIPDEAVFYLHGQRTGFVLMNTEEDMRAHSALLAPVFEDTGSGRVWIVAGYSGESDPVFDHLARVKRFDNGLYWIGYGDSEPAPHVREKLLDPDKGAFFTRGYDADSFFVSLTRSLNIFPPDLVAKPFTYLESALSAVTEFVDPGQNAEGDDVLVTPRQWIKDAKKRYETPTWKLIDQGAGHGDVDEQATVIVAAQYLMMQGRYEQILAFRHIYEKAPSDSLRDVLSMAYVMHGNEVLDRAKESVATEATQLFARAREMYMTALAINPRRDEALHNLGNLLLDLAKRTHGDEARQLFAEAECKYQAALQIRPDRRDVLINWGNLLLDQAKMASGAEAEALFTAAESKYQAVLELKADMPDALYQLGNVMLDRAKMSEGLDAERLFASAVTKYRAALRAKPDMYQAHNNWGNLLLDQAKRTTGAAAAELFRQAEERYRAALAIKPDMYEALNNWGNLLRDQAKSTSGEQADRLFARAENRYRGALAFKPQWSEGRDNLANLLSEWSASKIGEAAEQLRARAAAIRAGEEM